MRHIPALDGLRGVAVIAVMLFHFGTRELVPGGFLGVDVFFVLSGFLVTSLLLEEWKRSGSIDVRGFYGRRFFRLAPALPLLFVAYAAVTTFRLSAGVASDSEPAGLIITAFATLAGLLNWVPVFTTIAHVPGHLWSVSVEMQFYLVWPLILLGALRMGLSRSALFKLVCGLAVASVVAPALLELEGWHRIYFGSDYRLHGLLFGSAVACWYATAPQSPVAARPWAIVVACAVALLVTLTLTVPTHRVPSALFAVPATALASTVLVASLLRPETAWVGRWLEVPALRYVGTRSYGLYLWHYALMQWFRMLGLDSVLVAAVLFVLTFAVAELSYRLVESPASRWGRQRLAPRRVVPAVEARAA